MASESEMFALVWVTKFFRCYLFGRTFLALTDHSALTYLRNFSDQNQRLMRWSMKLSELDFIVQHRAGKKIPHLNALSRHVGTVLNDKNLHREVVREEQAKDKFCQSQNIGSYHSKCEFFCDKEGLIYRCRRQGRHQLVVPTSLIQDVIRANHDPSYIAHPGIKRTQRNCAKLLVARHAKIHRGLCPEVRLLPKKEGGSAVHSTPRLTRGT